MSKIIAIVGMCGSGKSVACEYLESLNYQIVYFGGVTLSQLKEENIEVTPENEKMMREKLRAELGMGAYAKILLPEIKELSQKGLVVLDGLYSWDELLVLKKEFKDDIVLIAIIADKPLRYERLSKRDIRPFTFEEANERDIAEIENLAKGGPISYADYFVLNNTDKEAVYRRLDEILKSINK